MTIYAHTGAKHPYVNQIVTYTTHYLLNISFTGVRVDKCLDNTTRKTRGKITQHTHMTYVTQACYTALCNSTTNYTSIADSLSTILQPILISIVHHLVIKVWHEDATRPPGTNLCSSGQQAADRTLSEGCFSASGLCPAATPSSSCARMYASASADAARTCKHEDLRQSQ